jgi:hypothetical protein
MMPKRLLNISYAPHTQDTPCDEARVLSPLQLLPLPSGTSSCYWPTPEQPARHSLPLHT